MATINMLEETANYLLNHCFVLGSVEDQRAKYLYVQDHLPEVRAVFKPLGYAVLLYPAPLQAAALVNEHEGSQARLLKYESILLLVLRLLYLQKRESLAASADQVLVTVEEVQTELQKMNLPRRLDQQTLEDAVFYISHADMLIVGGTSLAVYPAAGLIDYYRGNKLVLINKSATPMDARADLLIQDGLGNVFSQIKC